jgi:AmiR/NasT family two-component response regulator
VANETLDRLEPLAAVAATLGDEVVAREVQVTDVASVAREIQPDIAVVALHDENTVHALELIGEIVKQQICPVVAVIDREDPAFVKEAARVGIFAYTASPEPEALSGAIQVAAQRYQQAADLEGALGRRAVVERAKGVLMERHLIEEEDAFKMLRDHARRSGQKVLDVSDALLKSHRLLSVGEARPSPPPAS